MDEERDGISVNKKDTTSYIDRQCSLESLLTSDMPLFVQKVCS